MRFTDLCFYYCFDLHWRITCKWNASDIWKIWSIPAILFPSRDLSRDQETICFIADLESGPTFRTRGVRHNICKCWGVLVNKYLQKFNSAMGNCHTVGPNEALVRSGELIFVWYLSASSRTMRDKCGLYSTNIDLDSYGFFRYNFTIFQLKSPIFYAFKGTDAQLKFISIYHAFCRR